MLPHLASLNGLPHSIKDLDSYVVFVAIKTRPVGNIKFRPDPFGGNLRRLQAEKSARVPVIYASTRAQIIRYPLAFSWDSDCTL